MGGVSIQELIGMRGVMATPPDTRPSHIPASSCTRSSSTIRARKTMAQLADIKANEVLLACAVGDLSWLKRGISSGSNPGAANREVAK